MIPPKYNQESTLTSAVKADGPNTSENALKK
jgi:hypothetical protein